MPNNDDIYFVLNGLVNGEEGSRAVPAGSGNDPAQKDGWYFLLDGDADGQGRTNLAKRRSALSTSTSVINIWKIFVLSSPTNLRNSLTESRSGRSS